MHSLRTPNIGVHGELPAERFASVRWLVGLLEDLGSVGLLSGGACGSAGSGGLWGSGRLVLGVSQAEINVRQGRDRNSGVVSRHLHHLRELRVVVGSRPLTVDLDRLAELRVLRRSSGTHPGSTGTRPGPELRILPIGSPQIAAIDTGAAEPSRESSSAEPAVPSSGDAPTDRFSDRELVTIQTLATSITAAVQAGSDLIAGRLLVVLEHLCIPNPRDKSLKVPREFRASSAREETAGREEDENLSPSLTTNTSRGPISVRADRQHLKRAELTPFTRADQQPRADPGESNAADHEHRDTGTGTKPGARTLAETQELLGALIELSQRHNLVGLTNLAGVADALDPYQDQQIRHAVQTITRRIRNGEPLYSPFGLLTTKARERDPNYFPIETHPAQPVTSQPGHAPVSSEHEHRSDDLPAVEQARRMRALRNTLTGNAERTPEQ